ncbi:MAG: type II toxin-antitoxin system VapC family toxin [Pseudomonadales bacterium]|nr:type II toxin-antitoxin system VapC family toxin [Pseudomonadales bacterium]MCP5185085.1 type II toxin-antitoxin system VapC family toxin [Pseudomonadales bacterium]
MAFLLDTHALLWWLFDDPKLSTNARGVILDPGNDILVSSISALEIATKHRLGKLDSAAPLLQDFSSWMVQAGFSELPVSIAHATRAGSWPQPHRDPFDRVLAAQSLLEGAPLISRNATLAQFGVTLLW